MGEYLRPQDLSACERCIKIEVCYPTTLSLGERMAKEDIYRVGCEDFVSNGKLIPDNVLRAVCFHPLYKASMLLNPQSQVDSDVTISGR